MAGVVTARCVPCVGCGYLWLGDWHEFLSTRIRDLGRWCQMTYRTDDCFFQIGCRDGQGKFADCAPVVARVELAGLTEPGRLQGWMGFCNDSLRCRGRPEVCRDLSHLTEGLRLDGRQEGSTRGGKVARRSPNIQHGPTRVQSLKGLSFCAFYLIRSDHLHLPRPAIL